MSRNAAIERANKSESVAVNQAAKRRSEVVDPDEATTTAPLTPPQRTSGLRQATPRQAKLTAEIESLDELTPRRRSSRARQKEEKEVEETGESEVEDESEELEDEEELDEEVEEEEEEEEEERPVQSSSLNCGYCNMEYNSDPSIKRHFRLKHPECEYNQMLVSLFCDKCDKHFDDQRQFAVHMVRNHPHFWIFDDKGNRLIASSSSENKGVLDTIKNGDRFS